MVDKSTKDAHLVEHSVTYPKFCTWSQQMELVRAL